MPSPDLTYCRATITSEPSGLALFLEVVTAMGMALLVLSAGTVTKSTALQVGRAAVW